MAKQPIIINDQTFLIDLTPAPIDQQKKRDYGYSLLDSKHHSLARTKAFNYTPLGKSEKAIRLLRLEKGNENDTVVCKLFTVSYNDDHKPVDKNGKEIVYEALSWCWGTEKPNYAITISQEAGSKSYEDVEEDFKKPVARGLALALRYLRKKERPRILWIDAICINQEDHAERNHQVQMMSLIYTRASKVCIWLGEDDKESHIAIDFIKKNIMNLKDFDSVSSDQNNVEKWRSLLMLMQRPWFSRRWVVQEIALAQKATVYCGSDWIDWTDFAVAVELFVEVETATHRLSEVMQKDPKYYHVPGWFEHVSQLGASLLVQATAKVFRQYKADSSNSATQKRQEEFTISGINGKTSRPQAHKSVVTTIDPQDRRGLLSLEYLVSNLSTFKASEPRDIIYSLLAIAKDTAPYAELSTLGSDETKESLLITTFASFMETKPYIVDYARPYTDVCKDFISFCIDRACATDPIRALDILCRPWAPQPTQGISLAMQGTVADSSNNETFRKAAKREERVRISRQDQTFVDGNWVRRKYTKKQNANDDIRNKHCEKIEDKSDIEAYRKQAEDYWTVLKGKQSSEHKRRRNIIMPLRSQQEEPREGNQSFETTDKQTQLSSNRESIQKQARTSEEEKDIKIPSWVASIDGAAFALFPHPGMGHIERVGRKNADALVGLPQEGQRNYNAAQTKTPDKTTLRFRKRPRLHHHSLYVKGFILDEVDIVTPHSQRGNIDLAWAHVGGWAGIAESERQKPSQVQAGEDEQRDGEEGSEIPPPPEDFWRTLVADRGKDNRNPPYYYAKACKESFLKGGIQSGSVDTTALINNEQNSIIAEFCRRVQAVIWNRSLIKTKNGILGLASQDVKKGDLVCIIYGCTVPVILRQSKKGIKKGVSMWELERLQDHLEAFRTVMRRFEHACIRKYQKYPDRIERDSSWKTPLKGTTRSRDDSHQDIEMTLEEKLKIEGLTEAELQSKETYLDEIKEETEVINKKIEFWNDEKLQEDRRKERDRKLKEEDDKRVGKQEKRRRDLLEMMKQAKRDGTTAKHSGQEAEVAQEASTPEPRPKSPTDQAETRLLMDIVDELYPENDVSDDEIAQSAYMLGHGLEESNNEEILKMANTSEAPQDEEGQVMPEDQEIRTAEGAITNKVLDAKVDDSDHRRSALLTSDNAPTDETHPDEFNGQATTEDPVGDPEWLQKWKKEHADLEAKLREVWTSDDFFFYKVIGESYIHGMMDGEAIRKQFENKGETDVETKKINEAFRRGEIPETLNKFAERVFELR